MTPEKLDTLPPPVAHGIVVSYADALTPLYVYVVPLLLVAFVLTWFLPEKKLATSLGKDPDIDKDDSAADTATGQEPAATAPSVNGNGVRPVGAGAIAQPSTGRERENPLTTLTHYFDGAAGSRHRNAPDSRGNGHSNGHSNGHPNGQSNGHADGHAVVSGGVYDSAQQPAPAVLTLVDLHGNQVDRAHTEGNGSYRMELPYSGVYMIVCLPRNGAASQSTTRLLATDGRSIDRTFHLA